MSYGLLEHACCTCRAFVFDLSPATQVKQDERKKKKSLSTFGGIQTRAKNLKVQAGDLKRRPAAAACVFVFVTFISWRRPAKHVRNKRVGEREKTENHHC
jgi:hypothetical protein